MALTIGELAAVPRWPLEQTLQLVGTARGDTLGPWGTNLVARYGADALARVRARAPSAAHVPPVLTDRDRVAVHAQLVLTEAIVDEFLAGDVLALGPLLLVDTRAGLGLVQRGVLRAMTPASAFRLGPKTFAKIHERGTHAVAIDGASARLTFTGNPLFGHPTWRVLQLLATQVMLELVRARGGVLGEDPGSDAFTALVQW